MNVANRFSILISILTALLIAGLCSTSSAPSISLTQTIRGRVLDLDSKAPLIGVSIVLGDRPSSRGTISNEEGYFLLEKVPVGRHKLHFSYVGYELKSISGFLVSSGKESIITIELEESIL